MSENTTAPNHLGRYELVTKLATGGMAELFLARERGLAGLERLVVIKRILPRLANDPSFVDMFLREARIIARLNHPNVVQIYQLGEEGGSYYIAMEYIHGSTVREMQVLAERDGVPLPVEVAVSVVDQACRGLHAAHELRDLEGTPLGLIHRDVSPHNLMCTTEGYIKVLDFGVAKAAQGVEATNSGHLKGKFAYMSPEQCKGIKLDRRADIFSLGIVLWEALTDRRLFKREKDLDMMRAVVQETPEPPSTYNPAVPESIDAVVLKALTKDRDQRYASAEQMRKDILEAARGAGLHFGEDRLSSFLREIAGDELTDRRATMRDAMERSLTSNEKRNLLHVTGSNSDQRSASVNPQGGNELETVVERPTDSGSFSEASFPNRTSDSGSSSNSLPAGIRPFEESTPSETTSNPAAESASRPDPRHVGTLDRTASSDLRSDPRGGTAVTAKTSRRAWLIGAVALLAALAGLGVYFFPDIKQSPIGQKLFGEPKNSPILIGDPISMGWAPIATPDVLREEIKPIQVYLETKLGRPVPMEITDSYGDLKEGLQNGRFDVGVVPPLLYTQTKTAEPALELLAIREADGAVSSDALLLTMMDADVRTLADLEGQTFCFTDRNSTTGNFLPRAFIRRQGYSSADFIGEVVWSGNHLQALRDLIAGKCVAAATYSGSFLTAESFGVPIGRIRQLAITGHVPQDSVVVAPGTAQSLRSELRRALLDFDPVEHSGQEKIGEILQITGFSPGSDSAFNELREAVENREQLPKRLEPSEEAPDAGADTE